MAMCFVHRRPDAGHPEARGGLADMHRNGKQSMKKTYAKPTLRKHGKLSATAAAGPPSGFSF